MQYDFTHNAVFDTRWHSFWGGYSGNLIFGLSAIFHFWGGYSGNLIFGLSDIFHFGGRVFWEPHIWTLLHFSFFWGGILNQLQNTGVFHRIWTKISTTPAGSCITDSPSHTTYVETNDFPIFTVNGNHFKTCVDFYLLNFSF